jgi:hypothetical protein
VCSYVNRLLEEGARKASLNAKTEVRDWKCQDIPVPTPTQKRQDPPADPQITDVWIDMLFTGMLQFSFLFNIQVLNPGLVPRK